MKIDKIEKGKYFIRKTIMNGQASFLRHFHFQFW